VSDIIPTTTPRGFVFLPTGDRASEPGVGPTEVQRGSGERILIVDDDTVTGFALEKLIESLNYQVSRYVRPEEALARFVAEPTGFDLVVTDLAMPCIDGQELLRRVRAIRADVPVVVVSGYVDGSRQRTLELLGAGAVLRKPVSRADLGRALRANLAAGR
jgi:CheY-like chemotaxis protein